MSAVITDPPYYDSYPYGDLSDYFYVWFKRSVGHLYPDLVRTPLVPKGDEMIAYWGSGERQVNKPPKWFEARLQSACGELSRVLMPEGLSAVMFAHKSTTAWESVIAALTRAGLCLTASWPLHTEGRGRPTAQGTAALASSVTLVCQKRSVEAGEGVWDEVRRELREVASERLDFFWGQGIRGADFFISAIGPALSVFGRYERVLRLSGEPVEVRDFLEEVRAIVTEYALSKVIRGGRTGTIDPETRFYVVWKWSYGDAKVPADESFKLAQALGIDTETMWDRTGVLNKAGQNVQSVEIEGRMRIKDLGEPATDCSPASIIDVLHRLCAFREQNDISGMGEFLARSGQARNQTLWLVTQAVSEILPDGDKEKQLMQGLLNQREGLEQAAREGRLF